MSIKCCFLSIRWYNGVEVESMNYTKTIREYCLQNKGDLFDVSYMKDRYFEMVPYKTLLKILNRLEEEKILTCVAKGVYLINKENWSLEEAIENRYVADGRGMFAGYSLYSDLKITDYYPGYNEIYTNRLDVHFKTIGAYRLTKIDVRYTPQVVSIITLLDCIEKGHSIIDANVIKLHEIIDAMALDYSEAAFLTVIHAAPYHYSTIVTLKELLDKKGIDNNCMTIFERHKME